MSSEYNHYSLNNLAAGCCAALLLFLTLLQPATAITADSSVVSLSKKWTGDFDAMQERRQIRALVVYNRLMYFLDGPTQRGISYDALEQFRQFIDEKYNHKARKMQVIYIPVTHDRLIPALNEGLGDVIVANMTITPERQKEVDFSNPLLTGVTEILVTGSDAPTINTLIDLAGKEIFVRKSSSYHTSLLELNKQFEQSNLDPVNIQIVDEVLEDSDLLEMANAGLMTMTIVDSHKADFWKDIFPDIKVRSDIAINKESNIGWAFRKNSPELEKVVNEFVAANKKGTMIGNVLFKRYMKENKWVRNATDKDELARYQSMVKYFKHYANEYDFDWLMLAALGYQESRLDQSTRSSAGAIGVMQLLQSTASDPNVGIPEIDVLENNIHAGTKYLRFLRDRYFADSGADDVNKTLLTFASYNAGPAKITKLRKEAAERGLDPDVWFGNVEYVVAERVGRETVQYVGNIFKYYIAYKLISERNQEHLEATDSTQSGS
ncbi:MAG: peptidoglycan lytic exotransglycosylase [marine bacterium B5-7]|nr:MAG: peptidoglycan lytic exotransglycosylase [marine bacterium B5-7]